MNDIPQDFKIEHDRLIYEMEPIVTRLFEMLKELPKRGSTREEIEYNGFMVTISETGMGNGKSR